MNWRIRDRAADLRNHHWQELRRYRLAFNRCAIVTSPLVQHIGVDAMLECEPRYRHAGLARCRCQLPFELGVVIEPTFPAALFDA